MEKGAEQRTVHSFHEFSVVDTVCVVCDIENRVLISSQCVGSTSFVDYSLTLIPNVVMLHGSSVNTPWLENKSLI